MNASPEILTVTPPLAAAQQGSDNHPSTNQAATNQAPTNQAATNQALAKEAILAYQSAEGSRSPLQSYQLALAAGEFMPDSVQQQAVERLNDIWLVLMQRYNAAQAKGLRKKIKLPKGLYMWGGVGRGKSWLMDQFYHALPFRRKMRLHFHHFMQRVHKELNRLSGQPDPLEKVADILFSEAVVICFDEFYVSHVTDAMILGDLFGMLFKRGVTLVATSNIAPSGLYQNGIHRDRFMPAIHRLERFCTIMNVDSGVDYRLRALTQAEMYSYPLTPENALWMQERFAQLSAQQHGTGRGCIVVNNRDLAVVNTAEAVLWLDFSEICQKPRSAADYIDIANRYHTVLLDNVPELTDVMADATRRLIYLIDEFYDRRVKVVVCSHAPILQLYQGKKLSFEIERTRSRLLEMQSTEYLQQAHIGLN